MTISDKSLRTLAWSVWWLLPAVFVVGTPLMMVDQRTAETTWGAGGYVGDLAFGVVLLAFPLVGLLILRRQPRNTVGWLLQGIGLVWGLSALADSYVIYGLLVNPEKVPGAGVVAALNEGSWAPGIGLMGTFLILLYPDGHLPSRRWRPIAWLSAVTIVAVTVAVDFLPGRMEESPVPDMANPIAWEAGEPILTVLLGVFLPLLPLCMVACAVGLVQRFRRSRGVERQQLKWLASAGAVVALLYLLTMVTVLVTEVGRFVPPGTLWVTALQTVSLLSFILLPTAIGIAILRHGLYEIDLVINRTLVYGSLTATLAGVYLVSVLLLQVLLSPLTQQSELAVAGSTLAVAALFGPARSRIQHVVDRRFYRSRYDAARTLDEFSDRLRHQLDLDAVGTDLSTVVHDSMQPAHVSLWLRP